MIAYSAGKRDTECSVSTGLYLPYRPGNRFFRTVRPDVFPFPDGNIIDFAQTGPVNPQGYALRQKRHVPEKADSTSLPLPDAGERRTGFSVKMPRVAHLEITSADRNGDLLCTPVKGRTDIRHPQIRIPAGNASRKRPFPAVGDRILARLVRTGADTYTAGILKVTGTGTRRFLAVYRKKNGTGQAFPADRNIRGIYETGNDHAFNPEDGDLVWVSGKNTRRSGFHRGRILSLEARPRTRDLYTGISLATHDIPSGFPDDVIEEAASLKLPGCKNREDLRNIPLVTIDPEDAKDHDDAVFAEPDRDNTGGYRIIVAIADVGAFVKKDSLLDREAMKRGNSVYFPGRVIPMLPEALSAGLCSLQEGRDRPCLAVEIFIDTNGIKKHHRFTRAVMRSRAKLSYEKAQEIADGAHAAKEIKENIRNLFDAFRARCTERNARAPLELDMPEQRIVLDEHGTVRKIVPEKRLDAHRMIEEFMILANIAAAEMLEKKQDDVIYRVHDRPDPQKLESLRSHFNRPGTRKNTGLKPAHFNRILKSADRNGRTAVISNAVLRAQSQAVYDIRNIGHFGLNLPLYTHFTSPIRRYADLVVHRSLNTCIDGGDGKKTADTQDLAALCRHISGTERRAVAAERETCSRYIAAYLKKSEGSEFDGIISSVIRSGIFVTLDETGADGFVPLGSVGFDHFRFDRTRDILAGRHTKKIYRAGQPVSVKLVRAEPVRGTLEFMLLTEPVTPSSQKKTEHTPPPRKRKAEKKHRKSAATARKKRTDRKN